MTQREEVRKREKKIKRDKKERERLAYSHTDIYVM
jgi:hypothetical protein